MLLIGKLTSFEDDRSLDQLLHLLVERERLEVCARMGMKDLANRLGDIEVVGKGDSMSRSYFEDLMLAIAIESRPLNSRCLSVAPVEMLRVTSMGHA